MSIPHTVQMYLTERQMPFEIVEHEPTVSSLRTASKAHIGASCLAKAVLLEDELAHSHFLIAVVPASRRVDLGRLSRQAGRPVHLATEEDAASVFSDCHAGAMPPLGPAYGLETIWDDALMQQQELYFEAGDHEHLVRMTSGNFARLLQGCAHGQFSQAM